MTQLVINVGASPNDGTGDPIRTAYQKVNTNFSELFGRVQTTPPPTLKGSPGDLAGMIAYTPTYFYYCFANYTNGVDNIWATIDQTGNVIAEALEDGNSSITFETPSGPVVITINNVANVAVFDETGTTLTNATVQNLSVSTVSTGTLSASGNISTGSAVSAGSLDIQGAITAVTSVTAEYFYGNGAFLTGVTGSGGGSGDQISKGFTKVAIPVSSGNVVVDVGLNSGMAVFTPSTLIIDGGIAATEIAATITTPSQPNINQVGTLTSLGVTGDITGSNLFLTGAITASGDMSVGNITSSGNTSAQYFIGDGSLLTNISGTGLYGNTQVAEYLPTYTGNLSSGNISTSGILANTLATNGAAQLSIASNTTFQNNVTVQGNLNANLNGNVTGTLTGTSTGTHNGLVYSIDIREMSWDFGFITANTYTNPIQYLLAQTGNVDMGTFLAPSSLEIDTGTF